MHRSSFRPGRTTFQKLVALLFAAVVGDGCGHDGPPNGGAKEPVDIVDIRDRRSALVGATQNDTPYLMELDNAAYTELTTYTPVLTTTATDIDDQSAVINIGFDFEFHGKKFSQVLVSTNGFISFGSDGGFINRDVHDPAGTRNIVAGWWDDLVVPANHHLRYSSTASQLTVEWRDVRNFSGTTQHLDMQIRLIKAGNIIEIHHGPVSAGMTPGGSATVGLTGSTAGGESGTRAMDCSCDSISGGACVPVCSAPLHFVNTRIFRFRAPEPRYVLTTSDSTYSPISGTSHSMHWDEGWAEVTLPFPFFFYGKSHDSIFVSANGIITFGDSPPSGSAHFDNKAIATTAAPNNMIAAWWDDLFLFDAVNDVVTASGTAADGVPEFKIQWTGARRITDGTSPHHFRVHLRQDGGIDVHYGDRPTSTADDATMGLEDREDRTDGLISNSVTVAGTDCSPSCTTATDWPANKVLHYRRPTWSWIYDNYFAEAGKPKTLHCGKCHQEFQTAGAIANKHDTFLTGLFTQILNLDHGNENTPPTSASPVILANVPCTSAGDPLYTPKTAEVYPPLLFVGSADGRVSQWSNLAMTHGPNVSYLRWIGYNAGTAHMPYDCRTEDPGPMGRFDAGGRNLLIWYAHGAKEN